MNIDELKKQESELMELLSANRSAQKIIYERNFILKHGINVGDKIEWKLGIEKKVGIVVRVNQLHIGSLRYCIRLFKSNGELGKREFEIWRHELPSIKIIEKA